MIKKDQIKGLTLLFIGFVVFVVLLYIPVFKVKTPISSSQIASPSVTKEKPTEIPMPPDTLLGMAQLSFKGGTVERDKNIELGVAHINGTVIAPGETFSFTKALGPVTADQGYEEAKVFLNDEVVKGVGGGLCQVSTILFDSVLKAGLPVTERKNHTYSVSYYDYGLDATYSDPGPDLKFVNDTAYPITIKGSTENENAKFEIWGVNDGRVASTSEPEFYDIVDISPTKYVATTTLAADAPTCVNTPQIGYSTKVTYDILYATGADKQQVFTSVYKPLQRICYIRLITGTSTPTTTPSL